MATALGRSPSFPDLHFAYNGRGPRPTSIDPAVSGNSNSNRRSLASVGTSAVEAIDVDSFDAEQYPVASSSRARPVPPHPRRSHHARRSLALSVTPAPIDRPMRMHPPLDSTHFHPAGDADLYTFDDTPQYNPRQVAPLPRRAHQPQRTGPPPIPRSDSPNISDLFSGDEDDEVEFMTLRPNRRRRLGTPADLHPRPARFYDITPPIHPADDPELDALFEEAPRAGPSRPVATTRHAGSSRPRQNNNMPLGGGILALNRQRAYTPLAPAAGPSRSRSFLDRVAGWFNPDPPTPPMIRAPDYQPYDPLGDGGGVAALRFGGGNPLLGILGHGPAFRDDEVPRIEYEEDYTHAWSSAKGWSTDFALPEDSVAIDLTADDDEEPRPVLDKGKGKAKEVLTGGSSEQDAIVLDDDDDSDDEPLSLADTSTTASSSQQLSQQLTQVHTAPPMMTPVQEILCGACRIPLVLPSSFPTSVTQEKEKRAKQWALMCGHVICGACVRKAAVPSKEEEEVEEEKKVEEAVVIVDRKGKGRAIDPVPPAAAADEDTSFFSPMLSRLRTRPAPPPPPPAAPATSTGKGSRKRKRGGQVPAEPQLPTYPPEKYAWVCPVDGCSFGHESQRDVIAQVGGGVKKGEWVWNKGEKAAWIIYA
ncbi:hypothetical protein DL96DRAFT_1582148 [Flagelloscypha sp. PMI_526]|nr:hypothetical protein DL96DRAFT_1582148 [Flagelloscypha sp. PMI_526]